MPLRRGRCVKSGSGATTEPVIDLETHLVNPNARRKQEEAVYDRVSQRLIVFL